jgi:hypothetical protein
MPDPQGFDEEEALQRLLDHLEDVRRERAAYSPL